MTGIISRFSFNQLTWKCSKKCFCPKQESLLRSIRPYSIKKDDVPAKKKTLLEVIQDGIAFGNWKFYAENLTFKNLRPDVVPPSYKMCYRSGLETYANFALLVAGGTAVILPGLVGYGLYQGLVLPADMQETVSFTIVATISMIALWSISLRVPLRIYYSSKSDNFMVFFPRLIPWTSRKIIIQPGHVTPPTKSSNYLPWVNLQHTHTESKRKMLIDGEKFILPMYYNKLMGY